VQKRLALSAACRCGGAVDGGARLALEAGPAPKCVMAIELETLDRRWFDGELVRQPNNTYSVGSSLFCDTTHH
jgi:hypothetical protein